MDTQLHDKVKAIYIKLDKIETILSHFLNDTCLDKIKTKDPKIDDEYTKTVLKQLRYIEVFCSEGKNALNRMLQSKQLSNENVFRAFTGISRKCVEPFFAPNNEAWHEDSRASYMNKSSIDFTHHPGSLIENTIKEMEPIFIKIREHLDFLLQH
ncbi:DUF3907 family protein [Bacillaceae bacterium W0354]